MRKGLVILLWYFGIFGAIPAPEGWQSYEGGGLGFHIPPEWEEIRMEAPPGADVVAGYQPRRQFAPTDLRQRGNTSVILGSAPSGRIRVADKPALLALQVDQPRAFAAGLQRSVPGRTCSVASSAYDDARHRLWFRIEAQEEGRPPQMFVVVLFLMRKADALYIEGIAPAGDEDFLGTFQDLVNSFEIEESLRPRQPAGRLGANPISFFRLGFEVGRDFGRRNPKLFLAVFELPLLLALLAFLLLLLFDPLLFRGRFKTALIQRLQRSPSRWREQASVGAPRSKVRFWLIPLPWSLALQIVLSLPVAFWMAPRFARSPQLYSVGFFGPCYLLGYGLLAAAVALHYIPRTSRRLKYELLAAALTTLGVPGTLADPGLQSIIVGADLPDLQMTYSGSYLSQTFYFLLSGLAVGWFLRSRGATAARRASALYRLTYRLKTHLIVLLCFVSWVPGGGFLGTGFAVLVAFYLIGEKAREHPILYLRSFHDHNTNLVLAKIVMPTAGRFAPVVAIAHDELQPPEELYRKTNMLSAAQLTTLPDAVWQEWVLEALRSCRGVVIDVSVRSDGLLWELARARSVLPPERIAVLAQEGAPPLDLPGIQVLHYRLDWRAQRAARRALRRWLKKLRPPVLQFQPREPGRLSAPAA